MIASLGLPTLVGLALGLLGVASILLSSYKPANAVGALVIGGVIGAVVFVGGGVAASNPAVQGLGIAGQVEALSPILAAILGWLGGLTFA